MAEPRAVTRQEQILAEAQRRLDRIEKMREEMTRQVELEMQRLSEIREEQEDFTQSPNTQPSLTNAAPSTFQSQFDQFGNAKSNERLKPIGNEGIFDFAQKLQPVLNDKPFYRSNDRDEHYQTVTPAETFGKQLYVSGYYSGAGPSKKQYEYTLRPGSGNVSVGDTVKAPVHPIGYHTKKNAHGGLSTDEKSVSFTITDIYTKKRFFPYHDEIDV